MLLADGSAMAGLIEASFKMQLMLKSKILVDGSDFPSEYMLLNEQPTAKDVGVAQTLLQAELLG